MAYSQLLKGGVALTATVCMLFSGASVGNAAETSTENQPVTAVAVAASADQAKKGVAVTVKEPEAAAASVAKADLRTAQVKVDATAAQTKKAAEPQKAPVQAQTPVRPEAQVPQSAKSAPQAAKSSVQNAVDTSALKAALDAFRAAGLDTNPETADFYNEALDLFNNPTSQDEVDAETGMLNSIRSDYEEAGDTSDTTIHETVDSLKAELQLVINSTLEAQKNKTQYPNWDASGVEGKLAAAQSVYNDENATSDSVTNAMTELSDAYNAAVKMETPIHQDPVNPNPVKLDTYALEMWINNAPYLLRDRYTAESLAAYDKAIAQGRADLAEAAGTSNFLDQDAIDADVKAIETAFDQLEISTAGWRSILQEDVNYAYSNFKQADYTAESWKPFDAARSAGKAALESVTRAEPDYRTLDANLKTAEQGLKKIGKQADFIKTNNAKNDPAKKTDGNNTGKKLANTGSNVAAVSLVAFMAFAAAAALTALRRRD
ncbi:hypothetical protein [Bifidobacterium sp. ESL0704]|uniref:hypothetical protein n=1 Tax=Bifidobacterium sp. ESL0704 TaxID=2983219 RepID=UPI0023F954BA|nr:hypothetical protein [Bifidobacterium sp. ESL0704]WEV52998.1 hypothetical protein OZX64_00350 [Bifidobacterium sp. ESL0704]